MTLSGAFGLLSRVNSLQAVSRLPVQPAVTTPGILAVSCCDLIAINLLKNEAKITTLRQQFVKTSEVMVVRSDHMTMSK